MTDLSTDSLALARYVAGVLDEKKLEDIVILDVSEALQITDYFVIATGLNPRHVQAAGDYLERQLRGHRIEKRGIEGYREGRWLLLDYGDVVVHLFLGEERRHYDLELLWGDRPRVEWAAPVRAAASGEEDRPQP